MPAPFQPKTFQWVATDASMTDEFFTGILVAANAGMYRVDSGNATIGLVEPTETAGLYRIVGADLVLLTDEPLADLAKRLSEMSALDYLISVLPNEDLPEELPVA